MKHIKSLILKCHFLWLGIKSIFQLNLGDTVLYNGRKCNLTQGVYNPKWHMHDIETGERFEFVHRDDFKKVVSLSNIFWDIKHMYRFYMNYWYDIFMRCIPVSKCFVVDHSNWTIYKTE